MRHIQSYNEHINEELTKNQRILLNVPRFIASAIGRLMGIYPLLNFRWNEIKKVTKERGFDTIISNSGGGIPSQIKNDITKITSEQIPKSNLRIPMFFSKWNVYLVEDSNKGTTPFNSVCGVIGRKVIYISKDELKKGDYYNGERLDIDSKNGECPVVIMVAKFDSVDTKKNIEQVISDICIELEQDFGVKIKPYVDLYLKHATVELEWDMPKRGIEWSNELRTTIIDTSDRIKNMMSDEGIEMNAYQKIYITQPEYWKKQGYTNRLVSTGLSLEFIDRMFSDMQKEVSNGVVSGSRNSNINTGFENEDEVGITTILVWKIYLQFTTESLDEIKQRSIGERMP